MTAGIDLPARSSFEAPGSRHQLNPQRPSNPFAPTNEPDWIVVPKTAASQGRASQAVTEIATLQRSQAPFEPAGSVSVPGDGEPLMPNRASISRTASFALSASSSTSESRKPAPPVPKKPESLARKSLPKELGGHGKGNLRPSDARIPSSSHEPQAMAVPPSASRLSSPPPFHQSVNAGEVFPLNRQTPALPPPRRSRGGPANLGDGPPLPARRPSQLAVNRGGLMDESVDGAQSIPSLQPRRA